MHESESRENRGGLGSTDANATQATQAHIWREITPEITVVSTHRRISGFCVTPPNIRYTGNADVHIE